MSRTVSLQVHVTPNTPLRCSHKCKQASIQPTVSQRFKLTRSFKFATSSLIFPSTFFQLLYLSSVSYPASIKLQLRVSSCSDFCEFSPLKLIANFWLITIVLLFAPPCELSSSRIMSRVMIIKLRERARKLGMEG